MNAYRTTYLDGDYRRDPKTETFCCVCQKDIKPVCQLLPIVEGASVVTTTALREEVTTVPVPTTTPDIAPHTDSQTTF